MAFEHLATNLDMLFGIVNCKLPEIVIILGETTILP